MRNSARNYVKIIINANCFSQTCMAAKHVKDSRSDCEYIEYSRYSYENKGMKTCMLYGL